MIKPIEDKMDAVAALCRRYSVVRLELFGSATSGDFDDLASDLDFIVEFAPDCDLGPWLTHYFDLQDQLQNLLGRPVDLVMSAAPAFDDTHFRDMANRTRTLLYAA